MTSTQMAVTPAAEALRTWLLNQEFLGLAPVDVELRIEEDLRDEEMLIILVTLPTPEPGDTWPIDSLGEMRLAVRDKALELGLAWPWYVRLRPEHEEPVADEDREEQTAPDSSSARIVVSNRSVYYAGPSSGDTRAPAGVARWAVVVPPPYDQVMTTTRMAITTEAEELRRWLLGQEFLGLRPLDVELRIEEDLRDEQMLIILVTLPSPEPGDTWPVDATRRMSLAVRDKALDLGLTWPWYVRLRPEHEEPVADEDREEQMESRLR